MSRVKDFNLPDLGEGLTEGEIVKWLVNVGDTVTLNQPIVEVETAKAVVEIPAKWAGQVIAIHHPDGSVVDVGVPIVTIDTEPGTPLDTVEVAGPEEPVEPGMIGGPTAGGRTAVLVGYGPKDSSAKRRPRISGISPGTGKPGPSTARPAPVAPAPVAAPAPVPARPAPTPAPAPVAAGPVNGTAGRTSEGAVALAKPPVRKLARDLGVALTELTGTGPQGSITRDDVLVASQATAAPAGTPEISANRERRVPVKGVRKLTAENMVASAFTAPHATMFSTIDMTRAMRALDRLRDQREWRDLRVSPLLLVAKAVLLAVPRHPMINSSWADDEIIVKEYVNLGIAAATERGLIVPNISDAGRLSLRELAEAMNELVATAKNGRTAPADMAGGTFTISNVGVFGADTGTPILPPGEAAILAFGVVREQPWVHKGKVKPRQVTTLSLSIDHRIIDGELGSKFLRDVGQFLTDPETALLAWG